MLRDRMCSNSIVKKAIRLRLAAVRRILYHIHIYRIRLTSKQVK